MILIKYPKVIYPQPSNSNVDISSLEKIVGGGIELVPLGNYHSADNLQSICLIVRDNGALSPKAEPCVKIGRTILYGTIIALGFKSDGSLRHLTPKEVIDVDKYLILHSVTDRPKLTPTDLFGGTLNNV